MSEVSSPSKEPHIPLIGTNDSIVTGYDAESKQAEWDSPQRIRRLVEKYIQPGSLVMDIGIGTGQAVSGYREKGAYVIGIDSDPRMLAVAQDVVGDMGEMRAGDINQNLPIADLANEVDVVQAVGVLEFARDLEAVLNQLSPVLKEGGVLAFTCEELPAGSAAELAIEAYPAEGVTVYRRSAEAVLSLLDDKGFTVVSHEPYGGYIRSDTKGKVPYHMFLARKAAL